MSDLLDYLFLYIHENYEEKILHAGDYYQNLKLAEKHFQRLEAELPPE